MNTILPILFFFASSLGFVGILVRAKDRIWVMKLVVMGWSGLLPLLVLANSLYPFSSGGDDWTYFSLASFSFQSERDLLDLTRFVGTMEQPGYPWLLTIVYQFTGHDLLVFKALNLFFFIMLVPVWYRIGMELESVEFARGMCIVILCLSPLWYYVLVLQKDMVIVFLQSLFFAGAVQVSRRGGTKSWVIIVTATMATIPFRSQLVLVNVAVLGGLGLLRMIRRHRTKGEIITVMLAGVIMFSVLSFASDPDQMESIGIFAEHRVVGNKKFIETAVRIGENSHMNRSMFPFLYLLVETKGLNPTVWANFGSDFELLSLRGLLAIPWVLLGVPFFISGVTWLLRRAPRIRKINGVLSIRDMLFVATPWGVVLIFLVAYIAVSWQVGDTTRWRMPDMPVMAAIALAGWKYLDSRERIQLLTSWILFCCVLFSFFYLMRSY